ncbi:MAG: efflux RND transporter periplasmic adaptor subunit [Desulfobacteraceae bacterium]|nr:efflux RND transporter periplasmic adaptor subunit [Desulfobacteraceae bacterium]
MILLRKTTFFNLTLTAVSMLWITAAWAETVEYDGLIEPDLIVEIGAPAEGIVTRVAVDRSSPVQKGETLVELESSVEQAALKKAEALAAFDGEIRMQRTQLAFAKRAHQRVKQLEAVSTHDKDLAATEIIQTGHRLGKAREKRSLARLELKKARAVLALRSIKSPISGVVAERYVSPGEYVNSQPLLRVVRIDPLRVEVIVPARIFGRITPGMTAAIIPELPEYGEKTATVTIVDKVIDPASSTFGVRLELPNTHRHMPSGMKCLVRFEIKDEACGVEKATARITPDQVQN